MLFAPLGRVVPDGTTDPEHDLRRILDAILDVDRTGVAWQKEGVFDQPNGLLRRPWCVTPKAAKPSRAPACWTRRA